MEHATNRRWLSILLDSWKCRYDVAPDAHTALEKLLAAASEKDPFRIAILEMAMPEMSGEALGKKIRENPLFNDTLLVMLTSLGQRGDAARLKDIGFSAYLTKPVNHSLLYDALVTVLGRKTPPSGKSTDRIVTRHSTMDAERQRFRILLAEDNEINQVVALKILNKLGFHADLAVNGPEVVKAAQNVAYDLILMDCQMPQMDGFAATREIRNLAMEARNVPIIAMTAHAMEGDRQKCLEAGMNDYISKPVDPLKLQEKIEWFLKRDIPIAEADQS